MAMRPGPPSSAAPWSEDDVVADVSTLSWVNAVLGSIWPKANVAVTKYVHDELTPRLQEALPAPFKRFRFSRFSLGKKTPEFGPIEVVRQSEEHIQIELDINYFSDVDVLIDTGGMSFGINQLTFHGRLCLALKPLLPRWPIVCGMQIYFANQPKVELKFAGLAQAMVEVPAIAQKVQGTVDDFFRNSMVLPNLKSIRLTHDDEALDLTQASSHPPLGVLRVRVLAARGLAGVNWQLKGNEPLTSDPFCVLRFGPHDHKTSTVCDTTNPVWPVSESSAYFVVYHQEQELTVEVEAQDRRGLFKRNFLSHLGQTRPVSIRTLMHRSEANPQAGLVRRRRELLDLSKVNKGLLHMDDPVHRGVPSEVDMELEWLDLAQGPIGPFTRGSRGLFLVELHAGSGFPEAVVQQRKSLRWQCRLGEGKPIRSRPGQVVLNEQDPTFGLPIHPRILRVVVELARREMPIPEIAEIVDTDPQVVTQWLQLRKDAAEREADKMQQLGRLESAAVPSLEMRWHETLPLLVRRPQESYLAIELLEGEDRVVGQLEPVALQPLLMAGGGALARETMAFRPADRAREGTGSISSWLFPACSKPELPQSQFSQVRMDVSLRLQLLEASSGPRTLGGNGGPGGPAPSDSASDAHSLLEGSGPPHPCPPQMRMVPSGLARGGAGLAGPLARPSAGPAKLFTLRDRTPPPIIPA